VDLDESKIDRAVLALLYLGLHQEYRAWKGFDWDAMRRLHDRGFISDPATKARSVVFSDEGLAEACRLAHELFSQDDPAAGDHSSVSAGEPVAEPD
jgi:hypothetical protein